MKKIVLIVLFPLILSNCQKENEDINPRDGLNLPDDFTFTHLPTDLDRMVEFAAIGQIFVIPKAHGGFGVKDAFNYPKLDIPV